MMICNLKLHAVFLKQFQEIIGVLDEIIGEILKGSVV